MSDKKIVFTFEIDGIKQAYDNICLLKDEMMDLQATVVNSKLGTSLSNIFGSIDGVSKVVKNFATEIENLSANVQKIEALSKGVEAMQKGLSGTVPGKIKAEVKTIDIDTTLKIPPALAVDETSDKKAKTPAEETLEKFKDETTKTIKEASDARTKDEESKKTLIEKLRKELASLIAKGGAEEKKEEKKDGDKKEDGKKEDAAKDANKKEDGNKDANKKEAENAQKAEPVYKNFGLADAGDLNANETTKKIEKVTNGDGRTNTEATSLKFEAANKAIETYKKNLNSAEELADNVFKKLLEQYKGDDEAKKIILEEQQKFEDELALKRQDARKKEGELAKAQREVQWSSMVEAYDAMKKVTDQYQAHVTGVFTALKDFYAKSAENYTAEAEKIKKTITDVDKKLTESNTRKQSLIEAEKKATGGQAIVIQEQLAREMEANAQLTQQKEELTKQEAKLRKEAEKEEKRSKRMELVNGTIKAVADTAMGVTKALSMGLLGIPIAAVIGAMGAIQIATIKKQLDKINMEDGGLLRGKRHSQGGMRIEGTNIEVEGDEYVVNRTSTRQNLGLIDYINKSRRQLTPVDINAYYARTGQSASSSPAPKPVVRRMYEDGGQLANLDVANGALTANTDSRILDAIERINIRPVVSVVDIVKAQRTVADVEGIAGV